MWLKGGKRSKRSPDTAMPRPRNSATIPNATVQLAHAPCVSSAPYLLPFGATRDVHDEYFLMLVGVLNAT